MRKLLALIMNLLVLTQLTGVAMENKINFDNTTYNLSVDTKNGYNYYPSGENSDNWHSKITLKNFPNENNPTEAAAEFAHSVQSEHPGASVLVYPDAGMIGYLTAFNDYYEYNTVFYRKGKKGLERFNYAKRFYFSENNGKENTRKVAIDFAEKNNKKYMELVNKVAPKYKVD